MKHVLKINFDNLAISLSALCALHCLLLPVAMIFLPAISATFVGSEDFHKTMLYFVIPSSVIALSLGCKMHGKYHVYLFGFLGFPSPFSMMCISLPTFIQRCRYGNFFRIQSGIALFTI